MAIEAVCDIYEKVEKFKAGKPQGLVTGQIVWAPVVILQKIPQVMDVERLDPRNHSQVSFKIRNMSPSKDFRSKEGKVPVPAMPLNETEEYIVNRVKRRPCIFIAKNLVSKTEESDRDLTGGKKHLLTSDCYFLPIYSAHTEDNMSGFTQKLSLRVEYFKYSHLVYLPKYKNNLSLEQSVPQKEGIIRIDRIFTASPITPTITPTDLKISQDFVDIIVMHMKELFFKETEEGLADIRNLLADDYDQVIEESNVQ